LVGLSSSQSMVAQQIARNSPASLCWVLLCRTAGSLMNDSKGQENGGKGLSY
jgi:hypothetical protein